MNRQVDRQFESVRRLPARVGSDGDAEAWPPQERAGGKAHAAVFARGAGGPVARPAQPLQQLRALASYPL